MYPSSPKKDLICEAIEKMRIIQFRYDGRVRIVEPFCCGRSTADHSVLRGYQIGGSSSSKSVSWKLFELAKISQLAILDVVFDGKRRGYNPKDPVMERIYCGVPKIPF
jgi:hypothetical protein